MPIDKMIIVMKTAKLVLTDSRNPSINGTRILFYKKYNNIFYKIYILVNMPNLLCQETNTLTSVHLTICIFIINLVNKNCLQFL